MDSLFDCDVYIQKKIYSKNTDESLDKCRRVQTNVDESQNNVDKCRRVQTCSHQTSVDESLDGRSHRYANFQFVVLSVITAPYNVPTPHISKTHLPNVSLHLRELELNLCSKDQSRKKGGPPACGGGSPTLPPPPILQSLKIY